MQRSKLLRCILRNRLPIVKPPGRPMSPAERKAFARALQTWRGQDRECLHAETERHLSLDPANG